MTDTNVPSVPQAYHDNYSNVTYMAAKAAVTVSLCAGTKMIETRGFEKAMGDKRVTDLMNLVTDVALEFTGYKHAEDNGRRRVDVLLAVIAQHNLDEPSIEAIVAHLSRFDRAGSMDLKDRALALTVLKKVPLADLPSLTASLRGYNGHAANNLVSAAVYLLRVAELVMRNDPSKAYMREKLVAAERHLTWAKQHDGLSPEADYEGDERV